jgi:hypothetical protein
VELDAGGKILNPGRRRVEINLKKDTVENYQLAVLGKYLYNEKLLKLSTQGYIAAVKSSNKDIPTKLIYFGNYNPFNSGVGPTPEGEEPPQANNAMEGLEGYLVDELDDEDKNNDDVHFLGPIGDFMSYIKCGLRVCDVYYSEILVGRLYAGYLYSLNDNLAEDDFCPIEFINTSFSNELYIKCQCPDSPTVKFYTISFSYRKQQLERFTDIPKDIEDSKDLKIKILNMYNNSINKISNYILAYSIEDKKFFAKDFLSASGNYIELDILEKLEPLSEILSIDYLPNNTLISVLYYSPSLKKVITRGFYIYVQQGESIYLVQTGQITVKTGVQSI